MEVFDDTQKWFPLMCISPTWDSKIILLKEV